MQDDPDEYRNRVALAVYHAVIAASKGGGDVAVIRTGSVFDALMMVASLVVAGSSEFKDPQDIRIFCENTCQKLCKEITSARQHPERDRLFRESYDPNRLN